MPVHSIFAACGDVMYWYEQNQCVSYRNRLYFVIDIGVNQCQTLLTAAVNKELTPGDVIFDNEQDINTWRRYNWPVPDFSIGFQLISSDTSIPDYKLCCFLMCERVVNNGFRTNRNIIRPLKKCYTLLKKPTMRTPNLRNKTS